MFRGVLLAAGLWALALWGWAAPAGAATVNVSVQDNLFSPASITVNAGDTVQWNWGGQNPHTVTADDSSFDSGDFTQTTGSFSHTFSSVGTFDYHCNIHGSAMAGTVIVQQAAPTSTAVATNTEQATRTSTPVATPTEGGTQTPLAAVTATPGVAATATATDANVISAPASPGTTGGVGNRTTAPNTGTGDAAQGSSRLPRWGIALLAMGGAAALAYGWRRRHA
jgi:plastocyanin